MSTSPGYAPVILGVLDTEDAAEYAAHLLAVESGCKRGCSLSSANR